MFKERLKTVGKKFAYGLTQIGMALVGVAIFFGGMALASTSSIVITIMEWLLVVMVGLCILGLLFIIGMRIHDFINWLFIEPYKAKKKEDKN